MSTRRAIPRTLAPLRPEAYARRGRTLIISALDEFRIPHLILEKDLSDYDKETPKNMPIWQVHKL
jgi:hypothetical protein